MKTLVVVGTCGGAGATTLVALTFAQLHGARGGAPWLLAPVDADLALRAGDGLAAGVNHNAALWDAGVLREDAVLNRLPLPQVALAVVAPATPLGVSDAAAALDRVATADQGLAQRTSVVLTGVFGGRRLPAPPAIAPFVHHLPYDPRLSVPGPVTPDTSLSPATRRSLQAWSTWVAAILDIG